MSKRKAQFKKVSGVSRTKEVPMKVTVIIHHSTLTRHYNPFIRLNLTSKMHIKSCMTTYSKIYKVLTVVDIICYKFYIPPCHDNSI